MPPRPYIKGMDRPTVLYVYTIYYGECATDDTFAYKCFAKRCHFCPKSISDVPMVVQSPWYIYYNYI